MLKKKEALQKLMSLIKRALPPPEIEEIQRNLAELGITMQVTQQLGSLGWLVVVSDPLPEDLTIFRGILARASHEDHQQAILVAILSYYFQLTADGEEKKETESEL